MSEGRPGLSLRTKDSDSGIILSLGSALSMCNE
jgi:hypothetical protein